MTRARRAAVFLDRDGVLIRDRNYLADPAGVALIKGAPEALKLLRAAGLKIVVVSNQSGVARGLITPRQLAAVNAELERRLARAGARWDLLLFSPHGPKSRHPWRKPGIGMLLAAKRRLGLDLRASWLVGDKTSDIECARRAGCAGVLVRTGKGGRDGEYAAKPVFASRNLLAAARRISRARRASRA